MQSATGWASHCRERNRQIQFNNQGSIKSNVPVKGQSGRDKEPRRCIDTYFTKRDWGTEPPGAWEVDWERGRSRGSRRHRGWGWKREQPHANRQIITAQGEKRRECRRRSEAESHQNHGGAQSHCSLWRASPHQEPSAKGVFAPWQ